MIGYFELNEDISYKEFMVRCKASIDKNQLEKGMFYLSEVIYFEKVLDGTKAVIYTMSKHKRQSDRKLYLSILNDPNYTNVNLIKF